MNPTVPNIPMVVDWKWMEIRGGGGEGGGAVKRV